MTPNWKYIASGVGLAAVTAGVLAYSKRKHVIGDGSTERNNDRLIDEVSDSALSEFEPGSENRKTISSKAYSPRP